VSSPNLLEDALAFKPGKNPASRRRGAEKYGRPQAWLPRFFDHTCDTVVWNRTLAARRAR
jgi:hypothetical protein